MTDEIDLCQCPRCGRMHRALEFGTPPRSIEPSPEVWRSLIGPRVVPDEALVADFWRQTRHEAGGCRIWIGYRKATANGLWQPLVFRNRKMEAAQRWIWQQCVGPLPRTSPLLPKCGNRLCVALEHNEPVSRKALARDQWQRARNNTMPLGRR